MDINTKLNNKTGTGTGTGTGTETSKESDKISRSGASTGTGNEEIQRITVSKEAQGALGTIVDTVNEGFFGGKVNRTQMANWILSKFSNELDDVTIKQIRADHFDEIAMFETILRQAKETGKVPSEFKILLHKHQNYEEPSKKKSTKALTKNIINDDIYK
ncbi:MAG TPA: hypothetical protein VNJ01_09210 [Bacteriovoracaceae bacterium]|nr:hypothetical protein [Bacteriovoracaceae bacterium]